MINDITFAGAPLLLLVWLAGLPGVWRGQPKVSCWASAAGIALGVVCAFSGMTGSRHPNFWTGGLGAGDGFGLLGLALMGGLLALVSLALLVLTAVTASLRANRISQEISE